jgi:hypothetical protein
LPDYDTVACPQPEASAGDQQRRDADKRETKLACPCTWTIIIILVPFLALFLMYFSTFTVQCYNIHPHKIFFAAVVLPALSKSSAQGFLQKFSKGGVLGGRIEPGTVVQQSSAIN